MFAVGLMSGTSLDGVDAVLCEVSGCAEKTEISQIAFHSEPMPVDIKEKIKKCCANQATTELICSLNFELGELFAKAAQHVCDKAHTDTKKLGFIASHGQTIFHIPKAYDGFVPSTLQIGESAVIAQRCGCPVIADFRTKDMAAGGEGAPLVPYSEFLLYRNTEYGVALQNIGGIGNVTVLPKDCSIDDVKAFDTGPGNMMIDEAMQCLFHIPYDDHGNVARIGKICKEMQEELMHHPYIQQLPPKTTGREMFGEYITKDLLQRYSYVPKEDVITTLTWFTAYSIAENYRLFVLPFYDIHEVILGGGGAYNATLREMLQKELPEQKVCIQEDKGYSSDAKEAIAFVILGNETMHQRFSNVPEATGAKQKVILGNITYPD